MDEKKGAAVRSKLAQSILNARKAAGLTQVQLGVRLGLKGRAVYRWERGTTSPTRRHRGELLKVIQAVNPTAASALEAVMASPSKNAGIGAKGADSVVSMAEPPIDPVAAFENTLYQAADQLDVPARHLRTALVRVFARLRQTNLTFESAGQLLERQIAERVVTSVERDAPGRERNLFHDLSDSRQPSRRAPNNSRQPAPRSCRRGG